MDLFLAGYINCTGTNACRSTINCIPNEDCTVECDGNSACQNSIINCPSDYTCTVTCTGAEGCRYANIQAFQSKELYISGCDCCSYECYSMYIYCPPKQSGIPKCHISGDGKPRNNDLYAVNGFLDIDFSGYTGNVYGGGIGAYMHCLNGYTETCTISSSGWYCDTAGSTICDNPPTANPTSSPSKNPTNNPTHPPTNTPSADPSNNPTQIPTNIPTKTPTNIPSINPTTSPTDPSMNPTTTPTNIPTIPTIPTIPSLITTVISMLPTNPTDPPTKIPTITPTDSVEVDDTSTTRSSSNQEDEHTIAEKSGFLDNLTLIIIIGVAVFMLCVFIIIILICKRIRKKSINTEQKTDIRQHHVNSYINNIGTNLAKVSSISSVVTPRGSNDLFNSPSTAGFMDDDDLDIDADVAIGDDQDAVDMVNDHMTAGFMADNQDVDIINDVNNVTIDDASKARVVLPDEGQLDINQNIDNFPVVPMVDINNFNTMRLEGDNDQFDDDENINDIQTMGTQVGFNNNNINYNMPKIIPPIVNVTRYDVTENNESSEESDNQITSTCTSGMDEIKLVSTIIEAKNLNVNNKEFYLTDTLFWQTFKMKKDEFYKLKQWKQNQLKKNYGLF